jgi:hypothetical protein
MLLNSAAAAAPLLSSQRHSQREQRTMSRLEIDQAELARILSRNGLELTPAQIESILPGAAIFRRLIARVNQPLPREAEPALTFDVRQGQ